MSKAENPIVTLKLLCDVLDDFSALIKNLSATSKKHNMALSDVRNFTISNPQSLRAIISALGEKKSGPFMITLVDIIDLQDGLRNFMNYDSAQLADFAEKLESTVTKFKEMLREL